MRGGTGVVERKLVFTKQAQKDALKLQSSALKENARELLNILRINPFQNPPSFEKLQGELLGFYSRRINIQHRIIYEVLEYSRIVKVVRMWTHYE
ncbi:MAG: Txe/YoeB family addiction module toxin [Ruminiclostridium sp.]|nr:Txe/YoeB family addiction module toxin [Ruminiclostridium sp.]